MVDQAPATNNTSSADPRTVTTTIDGQDMTCVPVKAAAAPDDAGTPLVAASGAEETTPLNLNEIAPSAGSAPACEIPGRQTASADALAHAVTVTKPDAGQTKTYPALQDGQTYNLTFNYSDALVERDGKNVVIRFADGSAVILEDFADKAGSTTLIADNCEAAPLHFASLNNIAPAAGAAPSAGPQANTAPGNTGAGFTQYNAANLPGTPPPLGPLAGTSLSYRQIDGLHPEAAPATSSNPLPPDGKPNGLVDVGTPLNVVDETGGGGEGGDFSTPRTTGGTVGIDYGPDGAGNVRIINGPDGLTHHGDPITVGISDDGLTATGKTPDGTIIFVFTLDPETGAYSFTQNGSLDHPIPGNPNEPLDLPFVIRVTDQDGDYADSTAIMRVLDDAPTATTTAASAGVVDESNSGTLTAAGTVTFSYGGDSAGSIRLVGGPADLTSHGHPIGLTVTDTLITGTANGETIFTLTLNPATGAWEYAQFAPLDHADTSSPDDALLLGFTVRITDYDGDSVDTPIFVTVLDDGPALDGVAMTAVDETGGMDSIFGTLPVGFGEDGPGSLRLTGAPDGLTSGGEPVTVTISDDGLTAVGKDADGTVIFTLTITDPETGAYTFSQTAPLDHPDTTDHNELLNLGFTYTVTDFDGDSVSGQLIILVADDGPTAGTASLTVDELGTALTGTLPGTYGEDGPGSLAFTGSLSGLTSGGAAITVTVSDDKIEGKLGDGTVVFTLTHTGTGYSFVQYAELDGHPVLNIGYTVTDRDGDTATGTIAIATDIPENGLPTAGEAASNVDETGGFDSVSGTLPYGFGPDGAHTTDPVRITDVPADLSSGGQPVVITVSDDGLTATGKAGDTFVFTLVLTDPATGAYTFTQSAPLDHPDATNPDDVLSLGFGITVKDATGDIATANLTINVHDDGPVAHDDINTVDSDTGTTSGNVLTGLNGGSTAADATGADTPAHVSSVSFGSTTVTVPAEGTATIAGEHGTLTIAADGSYSYILDPADGCTFTPLILTDSDTGTRIQVTAVQEATGVTFTVTLLDGIADLNGFYLDLNGDGGPLISLAPGNNMNSTAGFDIGRIIGTVGGNDADVTNATVTIDGLTLSDLEGANIGIRATSVGENRDDSVKLVGTAEVTGGDCSCDTDTFSYTLTDADGDSSTATLTVNCTSSEPQPLPPHIDVSASSTETVTTETLTFVHDFEETRTWQPVVQESTPVNSALIGISSAGLTIGDNYTIPANLVDGPPMHQLQITFGGETAGYSNTLGWFVVGPNGDIQDVKLAVLNSDTFAKGGTVDLGPVAAGTKIEFFIVPNGAQLNNYAQLAAGGSFQFWVGGAPGTAGAHLATTADGGTGLKLYYVTDNAAVEIKTASGQLYFASHEGMNADGIDHIAAGVDTTHPNDLWLGFEDLKNGGDIDYNDLLFRLSVSPAHGTVENHSFCSDLTALLSDPDSALLSHATVTLNGLTGDLLELGTGYAIVSGNILHNGADTGVDFAQTGDGGFTLTGTASLDTYQSILDSVQLDAGSNSDGLRTVSFQVTDETGLNSNVATTSLYPACGCDDVLVGGVQDGAEQGGNVYVYAPDSGCQTIHDFDSHDGDRLDIRQVLDTHCGDHEDLSNFVKVDCVNGNTVVSVDTSGSGEHFSSVAVLTGVTGCSLDGMIADGSLEVGRFTSS